MIKYLNNIQYLNDQKHLHKKYLNLVMQVNLFFHQFIIILVRRREEQEEYE